MVDAKYDDESIVLAIEVSVVIDVGVAIVVLLIVFDSTVAQRNMSIKLVSPTIVIVNMAANRRNKWMSLKRLLILMTLSEKY